MHGRAATACAHATVGSGQAPADRAGTGLPPRRLHHRYGPALTATPMACVLRAAPVLLGHRLAVGSRVHHARGSARGSARGGPRRPRRRAARAASRGLRCFALGPAARVGAVRSAPPTTGVVRDAATATARTRGYQSAPTPPRARSGSRSPGRSAGIAPSDGELAVLTRGGPCAVRAAGEGAARGSLGGAGLGLATATHPAPRAPPRPDAICTALRRPRPRRQPVRRSCAALARAHARARAGRRRLAPCRRRRRPARWSRRRCRGRARRASRARTS